MDIRYEQRPAATGRCDEIALDHVQPQSYQNGPMDVVPVGDLADAIQYSPRFVVDPIVPREAVTLLSGHGDVGKSYLAATIAAHVACSRQWGPFPVTPGRVLFVTLEDSAQQLRFRLGRIAQTYGLDVQSLGRNLLLLDGASIDASLADEGCGSRILALAETNAFRQLAREARGYDLVIIDNASDAFNADPNNNRLVRHFVRRMLGAIARNYSLAVLLVAHIDKEAARYGARQQSYLGSVAWHNSARSRIALVEAGGDLTLVHEKHNHSVRHDSVRILKNDFGVPLLDGAADTPAALASQLIADADAILLTMAAASAGGVTVHAAQSGAYTAHRALSELAQLPATLRDRHGRRRFWRAMLKCQSDGLISAEEFVTGYRNTRKRLVLTPSGQAAAAVLQSPVPPAHHRSSGVGCGDAR